MAAIRPSLKEAGALGFPAAAREGRVREGVERTTRALRDDKARLADAKRETAALRRQVKTAERKAKE